MYVILYVYNAPRSCAKMLRIMRYRHTKLRIRRVRNEYCILGIFLTSQRILQTLKQMAQRTFRFGTSIWGFRYICVSCATRTCNYTGRILGPT